MRYVPPQRWPVVLGLYLLIGAASASTWAEVLAEKWLHRAGLGTFAVINLVLPLAAVAMAIWYPRIRTAISGAVLLMAGFVLVRMLIEQPRVWTWTPALVANKTSPIHVAATVGYMAVSGLAAAVIGPWRRVGLPDEDQRCPCGYLLSGLESANCPECGRVVGGRLQPPPRR